MRDLTPHICECGCGSPAKLGNRFVHGHNNGYRFGAGEDNLRWKGDEAGRSALHKWLQKIQPLTGVCEECGARPDGRGCEGTHHAFKYHGEKPYTRNPDDYRELCPPCHREFDMDLMVEAGNATARKRWGVTA